MAASSAPRFSPGLSQAELQAGYEKIGRRPRIKKTDVQKAYQPYDLTLSAHRKKATDASLFKEATKAVLAWHAKQAVDAAKATAAAAAASSAAGAASVGSAFASYQPPSAPSYAVTQPRRASTPRFVSDPKIRTPARRSRFGGGGGGVNRLM